MRRGFLLLVAVAALAPVEAAAQRWGAWSAGGEMSIDARTTRAADHPEVDYLGTFGLTVRGGGAPGAVGPAIGFDYQIGAAWPGGFAYDATLSPVGLGVVARRFRVGITAGVGVRGVAPGRIPFGVQFPIEASVAIGWRAVHVTAWARAAWSTSEPRDGQGAPDAPFGDELSAGALLRLGRERMRGSARQGGGSGYHVGVVYAERDSGRFLTGVAGYSFDFSWVGH